MLKPFLQALAITAVIGLVVLLAPSSDPSANAGYHVDPIAEACARQFSEQDEYRQCYTELAVKRIEKQHQERMDAAESEAF